MGREARCAWSWAGKRDEGLVQLETWDLKLRGEKRRVMPLEGLSGVRVEDDQLRFRYEGLAVAIDLGRDEALKWRDAILNPPSLAKKLGIAAGTRVLVDGTPVPALESALAAAEIVGDSAPADLVITIARSDDALAATLERHERPLASGTPIWVLYPKGKTSTLPEGRVRTALRSRGLIDTKVASVTAELTAARFVRQAAAASVEAGDERVEVS